MRIKPKHNKGFTLAEILITLLIIGVVASIVVPALINDSNEAEYNVGVKKAYAELSNVIKVIQINNGGNVNVGTGDSAGLRNEFCNVMTCIKSDIAANIFGSTIYRWYKGGVWGSFSPYYSAELNNGTILFFQNYNTNCSVYINSCGEINIDINGKAGPNMVGMDFYRFWIVRKNGIYLVYPFGTQGDTRSCTINGVHGTSDGCAAKRLYDPEHMP